MTLRCDHSSLARVARIALANCDHREQPCVAFGRTIDPDNIGHTGALQLFPNHGRTPETLVKSRFRRRAAGRSAGHDRIVAKIHALDADHGLFAHVACVISCPLSERPFGFYIPRHTLPLDHNLGGGGHLESGLLQRHHVDRFALQPTGEIIFG